MFKYGKKAGYMGIALLVLAVIPLVVAACVIPNIGPEVATKFNAAGEATRWGKSYELLALPVLNLLLSVATYFTAGRQAKNNDDSAAMARIVCERYLRNGCITGVFLNVINVYFMYSAITGTGFGLGFLHAPLGNEPASIFDGCCEAAARSWLKDHVGGGLVFVSGATKGECDAGF